MYTCEVDISWDPRKAGSNLRKHGVAFEEAEVALYDPQAIVREDPDAKGEQRFVLVGTDASGRVLTVVDTYREPDGIRLTSARRATAHERGHYGR
jgi:hypothetical protein